MISSISFKNFKALGDTRLELGRYNLIVGPNGSGKSTLLAGLQLISEQRRFHLRELLTVGKETGPAATEIVIQWRDAAIPRGVEIRWVVRDSVVISLPKFPDAEVEGAVSEPRLFTTAAALPKGRLSSA